MRLRVAGQLGETLSRKKMKKPCIQISGREPAQQALESVLSTTENKQEDCLLYVPGKTAKLNVALPEVPSHRLRERSLAHPEKMEASGSP